MVPEDPRVYQLRSVSHAPESGEECTISLEKLIKHGKVIITTTRHVGVFGRMVGNPFMPD